MKKTISKLVSSLLGGVLAVSLLAGSQIITVNVASNSVLEVRGTDI